MSAREQTAAWLDAHGVTVTRAIDPVDSSTIEVVDIDQLTVLRTALEAEHRQSAARITTHDSRCTLDRYHDGECNVKDWRG